MDIKKFIFFIKNKKVGSTVKMVPEVPEVHDYRFLIVYKDYLKSG